MYHISHESNRESIRATGLHPRRPDDNSSGAENIRNPAGAAVYLWGHYQDATNRHPKHDLWAVDVDPQKLKRDPSNLLHKNAWVLMDEQSIAPEALRYVGQFDRYQRLDLTFEDIRSAHEAADWAADHPVAIGRAICAAEGMSINCLDGWAYYDGPDEEGDWRTLAVVATSAERPGEVLSIHGWHDEAETARIYDTREDCHPGEVRLREGVEAAGNTWTLAEPTEAEQLLAAKLWAHWADPLRPTLGDLGESSRAHSAADPGPRREL